MSKLSPTIRIQMTSRPHRMGSGSMINQPWQLAWFRAWNLTVTPNHCTAICMELLQSNVGGRSDGSFPVLITCRPQLHNVMNHLSLLNMKNSRTVNSVACTLPAVGPKLCNLPACHYMWMDRVCWESTRTLVCRIKLMENISITINGGRAREGQRQRQQFSKSRTSRHCQNDQVVIIALGDRGSLLSAGCCQWKQLFGKTGGEHPDRAA